MLRVLLFCLVFSLILSLRLILYFNNLQKYHEGEKVKLTTTLLDEPKISEGKNGFPGSQTLNINNLRITLSRYPEYHYSDTIVLTGTITRNQYISRTGQLIDMGLVLKNPKVDLITNSNDKLWLPIKSFLSFIYIIRQKINTTFNRYLAKDEAGLLMGIVFGIKSQMDKDYFSALKSAGVLHVIAASGMNVTMVGAFLESMLVVFFKRQVALGITILGIIFYAVFSGLAPSIIRASIMCIFVYSAGMIGRQSYSYVTLFITAFIMLMLWPELVNDIGFQLSFSSTLGILSIKPILTNIFKSKRLFIKLGTNDDFQTTFSAQVVSLPIMLTSFSSYNPISIVTNTLVLWTIPPLMVFGLIACIFAFIYEPVAVVLLYACLPLLLFFKTVVVFFASVFHNLNISNIPVSLTVGYYFLLVSVILYLSKKEQLIDKKSIRQPADKNQRQD